MLSFCCSVVGLLLVWRCDVVAVAVVSLLLFCLLCSVLFCCGIVVVLLLVWC